MTARFVNELEATAVGIDCNQSELERGAEAFGSIEGLQLVFGDIFEPILDPTSFVVIIISATLQYFPDPEELLVRLLELLKPDGEILIADTPLYLREEIPAAAERTLNYYTELGFPQMADHYHHHALDDLAAFSPEMIYDPRAMLSRIGRSVFRRPLSPFPILRISKPESP